MIFIEFLNNKIAKNSTSHTPPRRIPHAAGHASRLGKRSWEKSDRARAV